MSNLSKKLAQARMTNKVPEPEFMSHMKRKVPVIEVKGHIKHEQNAAGEGEARGEGSSEHVKELGLPSPAQLAKLRAAWRRS